MKQPKTLRSRFGKKQTVSFKPQTFFWFVWTVRPTSLTEYIVLTKQLCHLPLL